MLSKCFTNFTAPFKCNLELPDSLVATGRIEGPTRTGGGNCCWRTQRSTPTCYLNQKEKVIRGKRVQ
ncbi:uncharacterized protein Dana_GF26444 [Drosophila ananassae]|uniref:Uncharacterized protein n=1 Tax=Drosophila ananassae TaxID=7217 RepID=A0A0N8P256_DROAN|nr:uncharacterized protein Dana_GF26444 [Drosophila ananassae]